LKLGFLAILGLLAYLVFLVTQLPVTHVLARLEPLPEKIQIYGAEGTVLAGRAALVQKENWRFEQVTWKLRPWALVTGQLEFDVTFHNSDENRGSARVGTTILRQPYLADLRAHLRLSTLEPLWQPSMINLSGWLGTELDYFDWSPTGLNLNGKATLENITWEGKPSVPIGDFIVVLDTIESNAEPKPKDNVKDSSNERLNNKPGAKMNTDQRIPKNQEKVTYPERMVRGKITDKGGPIQVQGQIQIDPRGAWQLTGTISPRANTPPQIRQIFSFLGRPDQEGRFPISFNGHLPIDKVVGK